MVRITKRVRIAELLEPEFFASVLNHNVTIIENGPNGGLMIIDTSLPENFDTLEKFLKSWGYSISDISDIVITHSHPDHFGNAERIKREAKAKIYAHELEEFRIEKVGFNEVKKTLKDVDQDEIKKTLDRINNMKIEIPTVDVKLKGGEELSGFKVLHVPGHTKGHIALFGEGVVITGDAVRNVGELAPPLEFFCWNYEQAVNSFKFLASLPYKVLIPYHGELVYKN